MKILILILLTLQFALTLYSNNFPQREVILKVNHYLNGEEIELGDKIYNFSINEIKFWSIQYFLMDFELIDKNGNSIISSEKYKLIDASKSEYSLGNISIDNVNSLKFNLGIDKETNHSDPSVWPSNHPLSLEYSTMHWGWVAGYTFIAIDGSVKDIFDRWLNHFQYHLVGNQYYTTILVNNIEAIYTGDKIIIELNTELSKMLEGVNLAVNNNIHGSGGANDIIGNNIRTKNPFQTAFSSVKNIYPELKLFPIPASDLITLELGNTNVHNLIFKIYDLNGRFVCDFNHLNSLTYDISNFNQGTYFLNIYKDKNLVKNIKFIKQ
jgi:hypothetical protein